jgi:hypothetical protein
MSDASVPSAGNSFKDDDLVYVDPETKTVVGRVEWGKNDKPKSLPYKRLESATSSKDPKKEKGQFWRKHFPFGTYKSMKKIYKLEGKIKEAEPNKTLEEVLPKALTQAYWTWDEVKKPLQSDL